MRWRAAALLLTLAAALSVSACGKKALPSPPGPPNAVTYPRAYPSYPP